MREIEFRGMTIKGGEWKYGDLIKTNGATGDGWAIQYYDPESGWMVGAMSLSSSMTVATWRHSTKTN